MVLSVDVLVPCAAIGLLWGVTNAFMKRGVGAADDDGKGTVAKAGWVRQALGPFTRLSYVGPLLVNQFGSLLFYVTLGHADISVVVPLANSITFLFTAVAGRLLGEPAMGKRGYLGVALVLFGVFLLQQD